MSSTSNFGFEKFGPEGRISDNNYKFTDRDRDTLDALLWTLVNHDHRHVDGADSVLAGPFHRPLLESLNTGGTIPAGQTMYYKVAYVDEFGNETEAGTSASVNTDPPLPSPPVMPISYETTGGALNPGVYRYAFAYYQSTGGLTRATNITSINVPVGTSTNEITIELGSLPTGAEGWRVYRKGPGDSDFFWLDTVASGPFVDDGLDIALDCTKARPLVNTSNATNSVVIDLDPADLPLDSRIVAWKIYRTNAVGFFGPSSLLATVVDTVTQSGSDLVTTFTDIGGVTYAGSPLSVTTMPPAIAQLDPADVFTGSSRLPAKHAPQGNHAHTSSLNGVLEEKTYNQFFVPYDMPLERMDVFFQTAPVGVDDTDYVTVRISDDTTANAVQAIYTDAAQRNEKQIVWNNATSGTFTLIVDGTFITPPIPFNALSTTIETELEELAGAGINDVLVTGTGTAVSPWVIEWLDPGNTNITNMLVADDTGLVGGISTVSLGQHGSNGGTFLISDGTDSTSAIAFDAAAATIETRIETDLGTITAVNVTGAGTVDDPWLVEFVTPGEQPVPILLVDSSSLAGTAYVSHVVQGHSFTSEEVKVTDTGQYHFWQSSETDAGSLQAEDGDGDGIVVSDAFATNDVAVYLSVEDAVQSWHLGDLDAGDYVAKFYVSVDDGASAALRVVDQDTDSVAAWTLVSDGSSYLPAKELRFTDTGGDEDWRFEVVKWDDGTGEVRVDKFEFGLLHPVLHQGSVATLEVLVAGSPDENGSDAQVTLWY